MDTHNTAAAFERRRVVLSTLWIFTLLNYIYADIYTLTFNPESLNIPAGTKVIFSTDAVGYKFKIALSGLGFNAVSDIISPGSIASGQAERETPVFIEQ